MARYRSNLPQASGQLFLADGGIETTLIFQEGLELPHFAAFDLLKTPEGIAALRKYFLTYVEIAKRFRTGLVLESATWRANADWGARLGYNASELALANLQAIRLLEDVRNGHEDAQLPLVISGCIGPRGDGYIADSAMTAEAAEGYHRVQIGTFAASACDMVTAITMNYTAEAEGIVRAAKAADMPVAIAFTVETDGRLPTGDTLKSAIEEVDDATGNYAAYYMINCAHPTHFQDAVSSDDAWLERIRGVRANASRRSHAELNDSPDLDAGDPYELGADYARLMRSLTRLNVMGGCCGTDHRHIEQIAEACVPLFSAGRGM